MGGGGGDANFRMTQTSFTLVGFTQPQAALPIIKDVQNNAKGLTSLIVDVPRTGLLSNEGVYECDV